MKMVLYTSTVEKYDPEQDKWTMVKSMKNRRFGRNTAVLDGYLYAVDGGVGISFFECDSKTLSLVWLSHRLAGACFYNILVNFFFFQ